MGLTSEPGRSSAASPRPDRGVRVGAQPCAKPGAPRWARGGGKCAAGRALPQFPRLRSGYVCGLGVLRCTAGGSGGRGPGPCAGLGSPPHPAPPASTLAPGLRAPGRAWGGALSSASRSSPWTGPHLGTATQVPARLLRLPAPAAPPHPTHGAWSWRVRCPVSWATRGVQGARERGAWEGSRLPRSFIRSFRKYILSTFGAQHSSSNERPTAR